jgi:NAD(P)-dependent dehydrogenase (short-subunit alcohol dehydrogenase family)
MPRWTDADIPDLGGRVAVVTGATGGLGLRVATVLASRGARVLLGARNPQKAAVALDLVAKAATGPAPETIALDLADLASVRAAATDILKRTGNHLDLLVNNGGIMDPPLVFSTDGFESQWATNVLGPAALTWQLLPCLEAAEDARVVWVSSSRHAKGAFDEARLGADLRGENYRGFDFYGRTKFADLLLSHQLEAHFRRAGSSAISLAAHPGFTSTGIVGSGFASLPRIIRPIANWGGTLGQSVALGALPILRAATASDVRGDDYYGPRFGLRGYPVPAQEAPAAHSAELAAMLVRVVAAATKVPAPA